MKQNLKDFLINLAVSMAIGIIVCMIQMIVMNINGTIIGQLIEYSIIGGVIGTISRLVFIYMAEIKQMNIMIAFITVFVIIGGISSMPTIYEYFVYKYTTSMTELVSILMVAELCGMGFCYYSYKKCIEINTKLANKKKQLYRKN